MKTYAGLTAYRLLKDAAVEEMAAGNVEIVSHGYQLTINNDPYTETGLILHNIDGFKAELKMGARGERLFHNLRAAQDRKQEIANQGIGWGALT